jgi:hypothetical protein
VVVEEQRHLLQVTWTQRDPSESRSSSQGSGGGTVSTFSLQ